MSIIFPSPLQRHRPRPAGAVHPPLLQPGDEEHGAADPGQGLLGLALGLRVRPPELHPDLHLRRQPLPPQGRLQAQLRGRLSGQ